MSSESLEVLLTTVPGLEEIVEQDLFTDHRIKNVYYRKLTGRVYATLKEDSNTLHRLHSLGCVERVILLLCQGNTEKLKKDIKSESIVNYLSPWMSFMVRTLRVGQHELSSIDFSNIVGNLIQNYALQQFGRNIRVSLSDPDIIFYLEVKGPIFRLGVDLTGLNALHRRTYRAYLHPSALNPLIAYAMCKLSEINQKRHVLDPMCGSGTILIEGKKINPEIDAWGLDINPRHIEGARHNAKKANLNIKFETCDLADIDQLFQPGYFDAIIVNPPFGLREKSIYNIPTLYNLLIEKSKLLLNQNGTLCLLTPRKKLVIKILRAYNFMIKKILTINHGGLTSHIIVAINQDKTLKA